jgi:hypothetical protein
MYGCDLPFPLCHKQKAGVVKIPKANKQMQSSKLQPKIFKSTGDHEPSSQSQEFNNTVYFDREAVLENLYTIPIFQDFQSKKEHAFCGY